MKKLQNEKKLHKKKNGNKLILFLVAIFFLLCTIRIFVANRLVDHSVKLHELELASDSLTRENKEMETQLANLTSLTYLREKALNLGFVENPKTIYVVKNLPVAAKLP
jgi:cell division protein FtsL